MGFSPLVVMAVQQFVGGIQQYQQNKANAKEARFQAGLARTQAQQEAEAYTQQAQIAYRQASIAQRQGEIEANKRSRILANDLGSTYANWAGNGLLVDGDEKDTLTSVVKSVKNEAKADIGIINENAFNTTWTYNANAAAYEASAANALATGETMSAYYNDQAKAYNVSAQHGLMQTISGIPSGVWSALGVNSMKKFGFLWGGATGVFGPGGVAASPAALAIKN